MPGSPMQNNMFSKTEGYVQSGNPFPVSSCGRRRNTGSPLFKADPRRTIGKGKNFNKVAKDKSARGGAAGGGMTEKGVAEYKRNNPGSKLKTAVTGKTHQKKTRQDVNRFALDQEAGQVKEVKLQEEDGDVKRISNKKIFR